MARKVLLLNSSYEVLGLISRNRAVILVMNDKVDVVEDSKDTMHSPSTVIIVPSVIRLREYVKRPFQTKVPFNRKALVARDKGLCQYCFKPGETIDHVWPKSKGGKYEWTNVVLACKKCNSKKDNKTLAQLGWSLKTQPVAPKNWASSLTGVTDIDPAWKPYLTPVYT